MSRRWSCVHRENSLTATRLKHSSAAASQTAWLPFWCSQLIFNFLFKHILLNHQTVLSWLLSSYSLWWLSLSFLQRPVTVSFKLKFKSSWLFQFHKPCASLGRQTGGQTSLWMARFASLCSCNGHGDYVVYIIISGLHYLKRKGRGVRGRREARQTKTKMRLNPKLN